MDVNMKSDCTANSAAFSWLRTITRPFVTGHFPQ